MSGGAAALRRRLSRVLGPRGAVLEVVMKEARRLGVDAYLVGGPVRDLLLKRPIKDIDVLLTGRLDAVARRSGARLGARVQLRSRFLTATLEADGLRVDLSRARRERYARPGALPEVEAGGLEDDLARRDFSVHAMALPLDDASGPVLLDPLGGRGDLDDRQLRILHGRSFADDPTRMLRGARYAARLGFRFERATRLALRVAVAEGALGPVSGDRIRHELERLLEEEDPARAAAATEQAGLFGTVARGWSVGAAARAALRRYARARRDPPWPESAQRGVLRDCGLRLLVSEVAPRHRARVVARLGLNGRPATRLRDDLRRISELRRALSRPLSPGGLDARLAGTEDAVLLLAWCGGGSVSMRNVVRYADRLRRISDPLNGDDARALGLRGPAVGDLLRAARERSLDGRRVDDAWVRRWLARHP
jgi:tRNA nucleotidyltransferase (CCA-adding enzyme)